MAAIVVGGSGKCVGKTALACGLIAALPEFPWIAVKITRHAHAWGTRYTLGAPHRLGAPSFPLSSAERMGDHEPGSASIRLSSIWEETEPGQGTDTARYLAAGANRAFLLTAQEENLAAALDELRRTLGPGAHTLFESNSIVNHLKADVCLAVLGRREEAIKTSFQTLLNRADALVAQAGSDPPSLDPPQRKPIFHLAAKDSISPELAAWLRARLSS
jgi:hypothetical protein